MLGSMFFLMYDKDVYKIHLYCKFTEILSLKNIGAHEHRTDEEKKNQDQAMLSPPEGI